MFSRNPNNPAQITIRLANERVVLESPKLREHFAQLFPLLTECKEKLEDVRERTNNGEDFKALKTEIIGDLTGKLKAAAKASSSLKKLAKRGSVSVCESLASIDSALYQMVGTVESLADEKLASFRKQIDLLQESVQGLYNAFERLVTTTKYQKNRSMWSADFVCLSALGLIFAVMAGFIVVLGFDSLKGVIEIGRTMTTFAFAAALAGVGIAFFVGAYRDVVRYFRATALNPHAEEVECEAAA